MKKITILALIIISTIFAQDITNKLGGDTASETYDVTDSNDNLLFRVQGDGKISANADNPLSDFCIGGNGASSIVLSVETTTKAIAISGKSTNNSGVAITGSSTGDYASGVSGYASGDDSNGVYGNNDNSNGNGVFGRASSGGTGVYGLALSGGIGVHGRSSSGYAGYFEGNVVVENDLIAHNLWTEFDYAGTEYKLFQYGLYVGWVGGTFPSDNRLKENISVINSPLQKIQKLRGVTYNWNDAGKEFFLDELKENVRPSSSLPQAEQDSIMQKIVDDRLAELAKPEISFIAQEVEEVFPEWVVENDDGYKEISMKGLNAVLVEAVKELKAEKDKEIQELKKLNEQLIARIEKLEKQ